MGRSRRAGPSIASDEFHHTASMATPRRRGPSRPVGRHPCRTAPASPPSSAGPPREGVSLRGIGREALPQEPSSRSSTRSRCRSRSSAVVASSSAACARARPGGSPSAGTRAATGRRGCEGAELTSAAVARRRSRRPRARRGPRGRRAPRPRPGHRSARRPRRRAAGGAGGSRRTDAMTRCDQGLGRRLVTRLVVERLDLGDEVRLVVAADRVDDEPAGARPRAGPSARPSTGWPRGSRRTCRRSRSRAPAGRRRAARPRCPRGSARRRTASMVSRQRRTIRR